MSLGTSIIAAIIGYFVLLIIGVNLIGIIVDGFVQPDPRRQIIPEDISKPRSIAVTVIFCVVTAVYLFALYNFWNIGIVVSSLMLMISRVPELALESKTGQKNNLRYAFKRPIDTFCLIVGWLALPVLWYSLFFVPGNITL